MIDFRIIEFDPIVMKITIPENFISGKINYTKRNKKSLSQLSQNELSCRQLLDPYRRIYIEDNISNSFENNDEYVNKYPIIINSAYDRYSELISVKSKKLLFDKLYFVRNNITDITQYYIDTSQGRRILEPAYTTA